MEDRSIIHILLAVFAFSALLAWALVKPLERKLLAWGMGRENFRGDTIPCGMGLLFVLIGGAESIAVTLMDPRSFWILPAVILGFGLLGFLDDRYGTRGNGGFKGHFRALFRERRLTTGAAKAIGGGLIALAVGFSSTSDQMRLHSTPLAQGILQSTLGNTVLNAGIIALFANAINLVDTRPGRAMKVWWVLLAALLCLEIGRVGVMYLPWSYFGWILAAMGGVALVYTHRDLSAKSMLGDVGSNTLGAMLGLGCAGVFDTPTKLVILALLIAFNLFCEKYSVSKLLDRRKAPA